MRLFEREYILAENVDKFEGMYENFFEICLLEYSFKPFFFLAEAHFHLEGVILVNVLSDKETEIKRLPSIGLDKEN